MPKKGVKAKAKPIEPEPMDETQESIEEEAEVEKVVVKAKKDNTKKGKKRKESYGIYIFKVLRQVHPEIGISSKSMNIMNSFVTDFFERISNEASRLANIYKKKQASISSREIQTATRLLLPGELAVHAMSEGLKAVRQYTASKKNNE